MSSSCSSNGNSGRDRSAIVRSLVLIAVVLFMLDGPSAPLRPGGVVAQQRPSGVPHGSASLSGRVVDRNTRRPIANVVITIMSVTTGGMLVAQTDQDGRYRFDDIGSGQYRATAQYPGYGHAVYGLNLSATIAAASVIVIARTEKRTDIDFELVPSGSVTGRVSDQDGAPLNGAQVGVSVIPDVSSLPLSTQSSVVTNARGEYTIANGRYTLVGRTRESDEPEATWLTVDLSAELTDVVLGLTPTASLSGRIVTDDGSAVSTRCSSRRCWQMRGQRSTRCDAIALMLGLTGPLR